MTAPTATLVSLSAAIDGGLTGIADVSTVMVAAGAADDYGLIGGVAVMLHVQRLGLDLQLRATGDAAVGIPRHVLRRPALVEAIEALGHAKVAGNRWERPIDDRRVAAVDLLVPSYRTRSRDTVRVGDVVTTELPGLAEAMRRPGVNVHAELRLTDGKRFDSEIVLPDAVGTLALKTMARTVAPSAATPRTSGAVSTSPRPTASPRSRSLRMLQSRTFVAGCGSKSAPDGAALPALVEGLQPPWVKLKYA